MPINPRPAQPQHEVKDVGALGVIMCVIGALGLAAAAGILLSSLIAENPNPAKVIPSSIGVVVGLFLVSFPIAKWGKL